MKDSPGLSTWDPHNHKGLYQREARSQREDGNITGFEDGGQGHELRNVGGLYEPEKERKTTLPYSIQKECGSADPFETLPSRTVQ